MTDTSESDGASG